MYYLYTHTDLKGNIFYIGKGSKNGKDSNFTRAHSKSARNKKWHEVAKDGFKVDIILESSNEEGILADEMALINECEHCINVTKRYTPYNLLITKISEDIAVLKLGMKSNENYYILLSSGKIFTHYGKEIKGRDNGKGYIVIGFSYKSTDKYISKNFYLHRLVAEAFIPNPENKKVVNHLDRNRKNNSLDNLQWCSQKENIQYSAKLGSYDMLERRKVTMMFDKKGNFVKEFETATKAALELNCTTELIAMTSSQNNLRCSTAKGYIWIYKEDYESGNRNKFNSILEKYGK